MRTIRTLYMTIGALLFLALGLLEVFVARTASSVMP
jgi:hypothetical protein